MGKIAFLFFLFSTNLFADISGIILDKKTDKPLVSVNIRIMGTSIGTTTDKEGNFNILLKKKQRYTLFISMMGYKKEEIEVTNPANNIVIHLQSEVLKTPGVTVFGKRIKEETEKNPLSTEELLRIPLIKPDPILAIQTLPGVTSPSDYFGWIFVRGGGGEENLYIWDGMELPTLYRLFGIGSIVSPFIINKFELYPGGFSCKYGNKLSSVVSIHSKDFTGKTKFIFWSDPTEFSGLYESNLSKDIAFYLTSRRSFIDIYLTKLGVSEDVLLPYWGDFEERLTYKYENGKVSLQMLRGKDGASINFPFESDTSGEDTISLEWENINELYSFIWLNSSEMFGTQRLVLSQTKSKNRFVTENLMDDYQLEDNKEKNISFSIEKQIVSHSFIECGINWKAKSESTEVKLSTRDTYLNFPAHYIITGDTSGYIAGGYLENTSIFLKIIKLRTGVRIDKLSITDEKVTSPRILISYMPVEGYENYLFWGHYYQFPKFCFLKDKNLDATSAHHYIFGAKWDLTDKWFLKFDTYYKEYEKLVVLDPIVGFENTGYGYAYGFDLILRKHLIKNSFGWFSYSYTVSRRKTMDYPFLAPYTSDNRHTFNFVYSLQLPYRMQFGVRYKFNLGRPMSPFYGRQWNKKTNKWEIYWGKFHSVRYPHYSRLDIKIDKRINLGGCDLNLYLTILNLLNRKNVQDYFIYNENKNYRAIYMLPIVPVVGIEGRF